MRLKKHLKSGINMAGKIYKNMPHGFVQYPVDISRNQDMSLKEKLVLCAIINVWKGFKTPRASDYKINDLVGVSLSDIKVCRNSLIERGLISMGSDKTDLRGVVTGTYYVNAAKVNSFFGCELLDVEEAEAKEKERLYTKTGLKVLSNPYYTEQRKKEEAKKEKSN